MSDERRPDPNKLADVLLWLLRVTDVKLPVPDRGQGDLLRAQQILKFIGGQHHVF